MANNIYIELVLNTISYCIVLLLVIIAYDFKMYFMYPLSILIPPSIDSFKMEVLALNSKREILESTLVELKFISACLVIFGINIIFGFSEAVLFGYLLKWTLTQSSISVFTINIVTYFIHSYQSEVSLQHWDLYNFITVLPLIFERTVTHIFGTLICYFTFKM
jgi:hypothetical protein